MRRGWFVFEVLVVLLAVGSQLELASVGGELVPDTHAAVDPTTQLPEKVRTDHLPNCVRVHAKVFSGGQPDGEAGYRELQAIGIKTVISVDGAVPDVETAAKYGLRYVHLPHGYDGISAARAKELAKGVRDLEGPIYLHCHHGKHRSPAAASVACVTAGFMQSADAQEVLELAGTSLNYRGLYQSVKIAVPVDASELDRLVVDFRAKVDVPPIAEAMVGLERIHDHINAIATAGWRAPDDHPDLDPAYEALLLREQFTELLRIDYVQQQSAEFRNLLQDSELAAEEMERGLRHNSQGLSREERPTELLAGLMHRISRNCQQCHEKFRDIPLSEKPVRH